MGKNKKSAQNASRRFDPSDLDWTIIAKPLLKDLNEAERDDQRIDVIIGLNLKYEGGLSDAKKEAVDLIKQAAVDLDLDTSARRVNLAKKEFSQQYLFASLEKN